MLAGFMLKEQTHPGPTLLNQRSINLHWYGAWWIEVNDSHWPSPQPTAVWPDLGIYWTLGHFLKPLGTINLPKSPPFLGNFCKGVKIYCFSSEIIFEFFKKWANPAASFRLFSFFSNTNFTDKIVDFSRIWTQIVGVKGEHSDHLITATAHNLYSFISGVCPSTFLM